MPSSRKPCGAASSITCPAAGKPVDLSAYFDTPEEVRLAYSILKNADVLPQEAELLKTLTR